jgi:predicted TIM-barrel fold metal-dependent hydrolase
LFGTDWPIAPVVPYVEFIKDLVPEEHHQDVFFNNALKVYPKLKDLFDSSGS